MAKAVVRQWTNVFITTDPILGEIGNVGIDYHVSDTSINEERATSFTIAPLDTAATIKHNATAAIIADAAVGGYTLANTDIVFQDGTRGL